MRGAMLLAVLIGCGDKDDTATTDSGGAEAASDVAPLTEPSSGECPDMSASGLTSTFLSSGDERKVTILYPSDLDQDLSLVFFFHGLMESASTPEPTSYMADALGGQALADELGAVIVLPQSPVWPASIPFVGDFELFMWDARAEPLYQDLVLYDDLRSCAAQQFENIDLEKTFAMGFSGGAIFTTQVLTERADTLAAAIEASGGVDVDLTLALQFIDIPGVEEAIGAPYRTPDRIVPTLLISGGEADVWPSTALEIVNFEESSDLLYDKLVEDDFFVMRCRHERGHSLPRNVQDIIFDWVKVHRFGETSPYETDGIGEHDEWCTSSAEPAQR